MAESFSYSNMSPQLHGFNAGIWKKLEEQVRSWTIESVTITTVGYGDKFPVISEGRIIAVVLMTAGVGLFGTFPAFVASWFVTDNKSEK